MQAWYPTQFDREMGCTEAELLMWLPGAVRGRAVTLAPGRADVAFEGGARATLAWRVLPPRQIALIRMSRLAIAFRFEGLADDARQDFMRHFDLYTQRGGG